MNWHWHFLTITNAASVQAFFDEYLPPLTNILRAEARRDSYHGILVRAVWPTEADRHADIMMNAYRTLHRHMALIGGKTAFNSTVNAAWSLQFDALPMATGDPLWVRNPQQRGRFGPEPNPGPAVPSPTGPSGTRHTSAGRSSRDS